MQEWSVRPVADDEADTILKTPMILSRPVRTCAERRVRIFIVKDAPK